jgi:hypothetical protein
MSGLTNAVLSPDHQFQGSQSNVGQREIARLMGRGKSFGQGPLPTFLKHAVELQARGGPVSVVLLAEKDADGALGLVPPIDEVASDASIIVTPPSEIPWQPLLEWAGTASGLDPRSEAARSGGLSFLVIGCHTDRRVQALATLLRNAFGMTRVAVSPHLVGSSTQEAHFAALRHNLPSAGVDVLLDLESTAAQFGLAPDDFARFGCRPCLIEPAEAYEAFDPAQRRILELICMHWTRVRLKPLAGGFSGSLLFMAEGWKGEARTEPLVLKVDAFGQRHGVGRNGGSAGNAAGHVRGGRRRRVAGALHVASGESTFVAVGQVVWEHQRAFLGHALPRFRPARGAAVDLVKAERRSDPRISGR